jgi:uncharacterized protein with HEPN domain
MNTTEGMLRDILSELADIEQFTIEGQQVFLANRMIQKAVIRSYEVIGEIVKRIPQTVREAYPHVDWRQLTGFRDFLAHNYDVVIQENVWRAVEDLPSLKSSIQTILMALDADKPLSAQPQNDP